jgi:hypothetical protein
VRGGCVWKGGGQELVASLYLGIDGGVVRRWGVGFACWV